MLTSLLGVVMIYLPSKLVKEEAMDKNKILAQARKESRDEGLDHARNEGLNLGYIIYLAMTSVIILFDLIMHTNSYSVYALMWAFIAANSYSRYKFDGKRWYQIAWIASTLISAGFLITYILNLIRSA